MLLGEIREMMITQAKDTKEKACRKGAADIKPVIDVFRGGEPVATLMITEGGGQTVVAAYQMAVMGFDADQSSYVIDSYATGPNIPSRDVHPVTGAEFDNRTLSDLFFNHDGYAKGWVTEAIFVHVANKAGDNLVANVAYHYASNGRYLMWDEIWRSPENADGEMTGGMAEPMIAAMNDAPSFSQVFPGLASEDASRAEVDLAVLEVIQARIPCHGVLWAHQGGRREETLREALRRR